MSLPASMTPEQRATHDLAIVQLEIAGYISEGTVDVSDASTGVDIVSQWKVSRNPSFVTCFSSWINQALRFTYPLVHRLAMDILPVQASSVSSERVFSSSKLTCTRERSRMSVGTVESLQVLKHAIRRRRIPGVDNRTLDFMSKLDVPGDEYID
ncbi:hypothetical protein FRC08_011248 [Ceratobasidium sp. 394]|nr:hypothetical protein FRC08_011248 [Ceratobasidium sp. 394]